MRAGRSRPARGQALFAAGTVLAVSAALLLLDRAGSNPPSEPARAPAATGAWVCPHGGGKDWSIALFLANPGAASVTARLTELAGERSRLPDEVEVPARSSVRVDVAAEDRGSATYIEYFGGWIGAGWVAVAGGDEVGTAAEPCAPEAARRWYAVDGTTQRGESAFVVVANPFAVEAVLDVAIYTTGRAPIRDSEWTDLRVPAHRSIALHLNRKVEGESAAAVQIEVSVGRVAVASLGLTARGGARSALGWTDMATETVLPVLRGSGRSELVLLSTADRSITFGATWLTQDQPRPAGGLTEKEQAPASARAYPIPVEGGPGAVRVFTLDDAPVAAALRALGPGTDVGATSGAVSPAAAWVVLPSAAGGSSAPGLVVVNPGDEDAVVTVEFLPRGGGTAAAPVTVEVRAHSAAAVPPAFLETAPGAGVLVRSEGGAVVALAASSSPRTPSGDAFAMSMGVPVPHGL